jgi:hypothetical protein
VSDLEIYRDDFNLVLSMLAGIHEKLDRLLGYFEDEDENDEEEEETDSDS